MHWKRVGKLIKKLLLINYLNNMEKSNLETKISNFVDKLFEKKELSDQEKLDYIYTKLRKQTRNSYIFWTTKIIFWILIFYFIFFYIPGFINQEKEKLINWAESYITREAPNIIDQILNWWKTPEELRQEKREEWEKRLEAKREAKLEQEKENKKMIYYNWPESLCNIHQIGLLNKNYLDFRTEVEKIWVEWDKCKWKFKENSPSDKWLYELDLSVLEDWYNKLWIGISEEELKIHQEKMGNDIKNGEVKFWIQ